MNKVFKTITRQFLLFVGLCVMAGCRTEVVKLDPSNRFTVEARINGKPARLAIDTGANALGLFEDAAERLGLRFTNATASSTVPPGEVPQVLTEKCRLTVLGTSANTQFGVFDAPPETKLDGVIGWPWIARNTLLIDVAAGIITPLEKLPEETSTWLRFPLSTNTSVLGFQIPTPHGDRIITIDTGSTGGASLTPQRWHDWQVADLHPRTTLDDYYMPGAGVVVTELCWADELSLGPLKLTEVPIEKANAAQMGMVTSRLDASLGLAALEPVKVIVDGRSGFIYLQPSLTPRKPYDYNRAAAVFVPPDLKSNQLIAHVLEGGPAYEVGIRNGDLILKVNGKNISDWHTSKEPGPTTLCCTMPAGTKLELTLKRGGRIFTATIVLRDILGPKAAGDSASRSKM